MRKAIGIGLVLLALAGMLLASIAEAGMLPGSAMTSAATMTSAAVDCPHHQMDASEPDPGRVAADPARGKALAFMPCCFGAGSALAAAGLAAEPALVLAAWLAPVSDALPPGGIRSPEPPPPRA